jgi:hypothetical protein
MNQEMKEFEDEPENQIDESEEENETEGVIEEPEQDEKEHELGLVIEVGMEGAEVGIDDQIDKEQRVLDSEERQMYDHRMEDPEELEIE